jgi:hypothetical protein
VPLTKDQYTVSDFSPDRADEPFGETIRPRTTRRSPDDADADVSKEGVEGRGELTGPISDEEPELRDAISKVYHQVADLLRVHWPSGFVVAPSRCTDLLPTSSTNSTEIRWRVTAQSRWKNRRPASSRPGHAGTAARSCRCPGPVLAVSVTAAGHGGSSRPPRDGPA